MPAAQTPAATPDLNTFTISMYEIEHDGDIENVVDELRANGLNIVSIVRMTDFTEYDSETGAVVIKTRQDFETVRKIVDTTDFTEGCTNGDAIELLRDDARAEQDHDNDEDDCNDCDDDDF